VLVAKKFKTSPTQSKGRASLTILELNMPKTPRTPQVLEFLKNHFSQHKYSPSLREIAHALNTSTSVISYCLDNLEKDGIVEKEPLFARTVRLIGQPHEKQI